MILISGLKYFMVVLGTWNTNWTRNKYLNMIYLCYRRAIQGILSCLIVLLSIRLVQLWKTNANVFVICECVTILVITLDVTVKALIYEGNNVDRLFQEIADEEKEITLSVDDNIIDCYNKDVKRFKLLKNSLVIFVLLGILIFIILKFINYISFLKTVPSSERDLIQHPFFYPIWLPFKESDNFIALLITIINMIFLFALTNVYLSIQIIFFALMVFVLAELKILRVLVGRLDTIEDNTRYLKELRKIAIKHLFVIRFTNKLNTSTKYAMLSNFLLYSINIATLASAMIMQNDMKDIVPPLIELVDQLFSIFIISWLSNEVKMQSLAFGDALCQVNWYNQDVRCQKVFQIILQQSQQPLTMSIGPFGPMTLETFLNIIRAAYSYITILRSFK